MQVLLVCSLAQALPLDPSKTPVDIIQDNSVNRDYVLAYDDVNPNIIYYAPTNGRVASAGDKPLVGFSVSPATGKGYMNVQFEFGVFGASRERLFDTIKDAGKTPVQWPFRRTSVLPMLTDYDMETDEFEFCSEEEDLATGEMIEVCDSLYEVVKYSQDGPSLGENLLVTARLTEDGAILGEEILLNGGDFAFKLLGESYVGGRAFEAEVTVNYDKLFYNFQQVASRGILWGGRKAHNAFIEKEVLCPGRPRSECSVSVVYKDLNTGIIIDTVTIDDMNCFLEWDEDLQMKVTRCDESEAQAELFQAVERLVDDLESEMLSSIAVDVPTPAQPGRPLFGSRINRQFFLLWQGKHYTYTFRSPRGINVLSTEIPAVVMCVRRSEETGIINKEMRESCGSYWNN
jgi:hypothetical protein